MLQGPLAHPSLHTSPKSEPCMCFHLKEAHVQLPWRPSMASRGSRGLYEELLGLFHTPALTALLTWSPGIDHRTQPLSGQQGRESVLLSEPTASATHWPCPPHLGHAYPRPAQSPPSQSFQGSGQTLAGTVCLCDHISCRAPVAPLID